MNVETYSFADDGQTPNNTLPVVLYRASMATGQPSTSFEELFQRNGWSNNWHDTITTNDHYHSTTHEVLGVSRGAVTLQIGGANGRIFHVETGHVLIIPAGVGHFAMAAGSDYEVVGGYPDGRAWDMIYNESDQYAVAKRTIGQLPLPTKNPVLGNTPIPGWELSANE